LALEQYIVARLWHFCRPHKVGTFIWLPLNRGLPMGIWLQKLGIPHHVPSLPGGYGGVSPTLPIGV